LNKDGKIFGSNTEVLVRKRWQACWLTNPCVLISLSDSPI